MTISHRHQSVRGCVREPDFSRPVQDSLPVVGSDHPMEAFVQSVAEISRLREG
jgi:hypothetical protein